MANDPLSDLMADVTPPYEPEEEVATKSPQNTSDTVKLPMKHTGRFLHRLNSGKATNNPPRSTPSTTPVADTKPGDRYRSHPRFGDQADPMVLQWTVPNANYSVLAVPSYVANKLIKINEKSTLARQYVGTAAPLEDGKTPIIANRAHGAADYLRHGQPVFVRCEGDDFSRVRLIAYDNTYITGELFTLTTHEATVFANRAKLRTETYDRTPEDQQSGVVFQQGTIEFIKLEAHLHYQNQSRKKGELIAPYRFDPAFANASNMNSTRTLDQPPDMAFNAFKELPNTIPKDMRKHMSNLFQRFKTVYPDCTALTEILFYQFLVHLKKLSLINGGTKSTPWVDDTWPDNHVAGQSWIPPAVLDNAIILMLEWRSDQTRREGFHKYYLQRKLAKSLPPISGDGVVWLDSILTLAEEELFLYKGGFYLGIEHQQVQYAPSEELANTSSRVEHEPNRDQSSTLSQQPAMRRIEFDDQPLAEAIDNMPRFEEEQKWPYPPPSSGPRVYQDFVVKQSHTPIPLDVIRALYSVLDNDFRKALDEMAKNALQDGEGYMPTNEANWDAVVKKGLQHAPGVINAIIRRYTPAIATHVDLPNKFTAKDPPTAEQARALLERLTSESWHKTIAAFVRRNDDEGDPISTLHSPIEWLMQDPARANDLLQEPVDDAKVRVMRIVPAPELDDASRDDGSLDGGAPVTNQPQDDTSRATHNAETSTPATSNSTSRIDLYKKYLPAGIGGNAHRIPEGHVFTVASPPTQKQIAYLFTQIRGGEDDYANQFIPFYLNDISTINQNGYVLLFLQPNQHVGLSTSPTDLASLWHRAISSGFGDVSRHVDAINDLVQMTPSAVEPKKKYIAPQPEVRSAADRTGPQSSSTATKKPEASKNADHHDRTRRRRSSSLSTTPETARKSVHEDGSLRDKRLRLNNTPQTPLAASGLRDQLNPTNVKSSRPNIQPSPLQGASNTAGKLPQLAPPVAPAARPTPIPASVPASTTPAGTTAASADGSTANSERNKARLNLVLETMNNTPGALIKFGNDLKIDELLNKAAQVYGDDLRFRTYISAACLKLGLEVPQ